MINERQRRRGEVMTQVSTKTGYDIRYNPVTKKYDVYFVYSNGSEIRCSSGWNSKLDANYELSRG